MHRPRSAALLLAGALSVSPISQAMPAARDRTTMHDPLAALTVDARYDAATRKLTLAYQLTGAKRPLAVFDRGDSMALRTHKLVPGEPAAPTFAQEGDGVVFSHRAMPLGKPPPIVPHAPLAAKLDPGASHAGEVVVDVPVDARRARYCLGIIPFPAEGFRSMPDAGPGVWEASFRVVDQQTVLCTPWLDLASGRFASP